jgi:hypothetical protein
VFVARFVGLFDFVVEHLRVVDAEAAVQPAQAHHFVDHVQAVFGECTLLELLQDLALGPFVLAQRLVEEGAGFAATEFFALQLFEIFLIVRFRL